MSEPKALSTPVLLHIAQLLNIPLKSLVATIGLFDEGGTVPFISRYRKEATGALDEIQIRAIQEKLEYFRELEDRRETVLSTIQEQGKLTAELRAKIESVLEKNELEDLYLPFKPKRRTKASIAREKGLEPLAQYLWDQKPGAQPLADLAAAFSMDAEEALEGARHIVAEWISENAEFRKTTRQFMLDHGLVVSKAIEGAVDPEGKYKMYVQFSEPAAKIPSHRMLAIRRGAKEGILRFEIELDPAQPLIYLKNKVIREQGDWVPQLELAVEDSYERLLNPSIQTEVRLELKDRSDDEAIRVFRENLENLLLAPPAGMLPVLAVDPGIRTGCKLAVVDETGKFLDSAVIHPMEPRQDLAGAVMTVSGLISRHHVQAVAIGNGTGSREANAFVQDFLRQAGLDKVFSVMVSEAGASVYSASELAGREFPHLDVTIRGAISIGRRLQDPLAELVKIDPKSIGVGQYQHDVDQRLLKRKLEESVESCVNHVGVDVNTASKELLGYVAGLTATVARNIVAHRNANGVFRSRNDLREVPKLGPKAFEQAAGFLRIRGGVNPLDNTAVHPERYELVERIATDLGVRPDEITRIPERLRSLDLGRYVTDGVGEPTLRDILAELEKPGRDPRAEFRYATFAAGVTEIKDLRPGMALEGVVTNVANFGAFVDIGVHQDGLVHISQLADRFVDDPKKVVKVGQVVRVRVLEVNEQLKRIGLSMKSPGRGAGPPAGGGGRRDDQRGATSEPKPRYTVSDLMAKFNKKR